MNKDDKNIILLTGDKDLRPAIKFAKKLCKNIYLVGFNKLTK